MSSVNSHCVFQAYSIKSYFVWSSVSFVLKWYFDLKFFHFFLSSVIMVRRTLAHKITSHIYSPLLFFSPLPLSYSLRPIFYKFMLSFLTLFSRAVLLEFLIYSKFLWKFILLTKKTFFLI